MSRKLVFVLFLHGILCTSMDITEEKTDHITCLFLWQWHRTPTTQETDGFQVKRPGDVSVRCTLLLMLDYQVSTLLLAWKIQPLGHSATEQIHPVTYIKTQYTWIQNVT